jgi:ubiquinone biosynthesis protein UbiJ
MLLIETAINRYLALDPEMLTKLAAFSGKVIKIELSGIGKQFYIFPSDRGVDVRAEYDEDADTVLRGTPITLFKMGVTSNAATMLLKGEVEITGDTRLGHQFKQAFSEMDIDWSEPLAELVGDGVAYQLQQVSKNFVSWGKQSLQSVSLSASEYLQEESRDVVTETELEIFNQSVDKIRNDVDRLEAKIKKLSL